MYNNVLATLQAMEQGKLLWFTQAAGGPDMTSPATVTLLITGPFGGPAAEYLTTLAADGLTPTYLTTGTEFLFAGMYFLQLRYNNFDKVYWTAVGEVLVVENLD